MCVSATTAHSLTLLGLGCFRRDIVARMMMVVGAMMMMMMMDDKGMKKKERRERLQTCSGEERNQNGVSEGMCKLGQTLLRLLLLLLPPSSTASSSSLLFLPSLSSPGDKSRGKESSRGQCYFR